MDEDKEEDKTEEGLEVQQAWRRKRKHNKGDGNDDNNEKSVRGMVEAVAELGGYFEGVSGECVGGGQGTERW
ncbi:hypothetical protein N0V85_003282 [Neurospora sp. IMI 360204]|nr:hypothetical protein N0V85_003282 [Neurospora sp. IMI 360204]